MAKKQHHYLEAVAWLGGAFLGYEFLYKPWQAEQAAIAAAGSTPDVWAGLPFVTYNPTTTTTTPTTATTTPTTTATPAPVVTPPAPAVIPTTTAPNPVASPPQTPGPTTTPAPATIQPQTNTVISGDPVPAPAIVTPPTPPILPPGGASDVSTLTPAQQAVVNNIYGPQAWQNATTATAALGEQSNIDLPFFGIPTNIAVSS